jgi:hypothetical protein
LLYNVFTVSKSENAIATNPTYDDIETTTIIIDYEKKVSYSGTYTKGEYPYVGYHYNDYDRSKVEILIPMIDKWSAELYYPPIVFYPDKLNTGETYKHDYSFFQPIDSQDSISKIGANPIYTTANYKVIDLKQIEEYDIYTIEAECNESACKTIFSISYPELINDILLIKGKDTIKLENIHYISE